MTTSRLPLGDETLIRRAARGITVQVAGLVAAAIVLLVVLVSVVVVRGQTSAADALLRTTVTTADDVGDPPHGTWLVLTRGDKSVSSPGLPIDLASALARARSLATAQTRFINLSARDTREYRVATQEQSDRTVQVVLDLTAEHQLRSRLLKAMALASVVGLLFAVALGVVLARRAVRPLAQALALQRAFVADASHELRTPLTLLSTRAQVLDQAIQRSVVDRQIVKDSRGVVEDTLRLAEVVDDLLLAADPLTAQQHEPVELGALVCSVIESATAHANQADIVLSDVTVGSGPYWVIGSAPALRRAVLALVDNAIDHTPSRGEVRVRTQRHRQSVIISVSDTGPGVASEAIQDLSLRFHSGEHRAGRAHYGLGLALTHEIANRHGGQLRLAHSDVGASFEIVLPESGAPRAAPAHSALPGKSKNPPRI